jgi:hypothetical protein
MQAFLGALEVADRSTYTVSPPRIWGVLLRLARRLAVAQASLLLERSAAYGLMLSVELFDAEAQGFPAEPGNFIRRHAPHPVAKQLPCTLEPAHVEVYSSTEQVTDGLLGCRKEVESPDKKLHIPCAG